MAKPRVGDGTGIGGSVPDVQGQTADENAKPQAGSGSGSGDSGSGSELAKGQHRSEK